MRVGSDTEVLALGDGGVCRICRIRKLFISSRRIGLVDLKESRVDGDGGNVMGLWQRLGGLLQDGMLCKWCVFLCMTEVNGIGHHRGDEPRGEDVQFDRLAELIRCQ